MGADRVLRTFKRRDPGELRRCIDAGIGVDGQLARDVAPRLRPHGIAEPPSGHRVRVRPAVEQNEPVPNLRIVEQRLMREAVIGELAKNLIRT